MAIALRFYDDILDDAPIPRSEVSRELVRDPKRIVLGMPRGALSGSHIRFHAHHAGVKIAETLEETIAAAHALVDQRSQ